MIALLLAAATASVAAPAAPATPPLPMVRGFRDLALSPDGGRTATVESVQALGATADPHSEIVVRKASDGSIVERFDPCATCTYKGLSWSPDGKALAFTAGDFKARTAVLHVVEAGKMRSVAAVKGIAGQARWSPDGARIAWLTTPGARKQSGAVEAGIPQTGVIGSDNDEQRIAVVPASGGELKLVSPADTYVYEFDWTPDGRAFVATAAKGDGDNNWWTAKLETFDAETGAERVIASPKVQMNFPRVTADGKTALVIGGLMSDFGPVGGDLWAAPLAGGELVDLTPDFKATFSSLTVKGGRVLATVLAGDKAEVVEVDLKTRAVKVLWSAPLDVSAGDGKVSFSADGRRAATIAQDFTRAPEVFSGPVERLAAVTHDNTALAQPFTARSVSWTSDGFNVQGWLLEPKGVVAGKTYPMVVQVHGGPSSAVTPRFMDSGATRTLLERGYYVFEPNPRGSYGQGEAFTKANVRDFGGGDLKDILAGVDAVEKIAPVDDRRLGVMGHSYGGFMSMWTVTHSQRFHAAVAGAGLANWISYYGENGIDQWMIPFFGASAYDDPAIYWDLSPLKTIKQARTPTFIYVGERDVECPAPQSQEFWHALVAQGVETQLVIYPGEGHAIRGVEARRDLESRTVGWFDQHLKP